MKEKIALYSFTHVDRSGRVRWLLAELDIPVEEHRITFGKQGDADYKRLNPFGKIPSAHVGDETLFESGGICLFLADKYGAGKVAPRTDEPDRAAYSQWLMWACASLDPAVFKDVSTNGKVDPEKVAALKKTLPPIFDALSAHLESRTYVLGERFSTADIIIGQVLEMGGRMGFIDEYPALKSYVRRLAAREGAKRSRVFTAKTPQ